MPETENAIAVSSNEPRGYEDLTQDDFTIPRIKLLNASSKECKEQTAKPGLFFNILEGSSFENARVVPLKVWKGMSNFPQGEERPICRSNNAFEPSKSIENPVSSACGHVVKCRWQPLCLAAQWKECPGDEKDTPPACTRKYTLLLLLIEEGEEPYPFLIDTKKKGLASVKRMVTAAKSRRKDLFAFNWKMSSATEPYGNDVYHILNFTDAQKGDPAQYVEYYDKLASYDIEKTPDEDVPTDDDGKPLF